MTFDEWVRYLWSREQAQLGAVRSEWTDNLAGAGLAVDDVVAGTGAVESPPPPSASPSPPKPTLRSVGEQVQDLLMEMKTIPRASELEQLCQEESQLVRTFSEALDSGSEVYQTVQAVRRENAEIAANELVASVRASKSTLMGSIRSASRTSSKSSGEGIHTVGGGGVCSFCLSQPWPWP